MSSVPSRFEGVAIDTKANIYFDGNVVSHAFYLATGEKKTLGLIRPGSYHFGTGAPERMEIVAGECRVTLDGVASPSTFAAGTAFDVPGNSGFTIEVSSGLCEYLCSFLPV